MRSGGCTPRRCVRRSWRRCYQNSCRTQDGHAQRSRWRMSYTGSASLAARPNCEYVDVVPKGVGKALAVARVAAAHLEVRQGRLQRGRTDDMEMLSRCSTMEENASMGCLTWTVKTVRESAGTGLRGGVCMAMQSGRFGGWRAAVDWYLATRWRPAARRSCSLVHAYRLHSNRHLYPERRCQLALRTVALLLGMLYYWLIPLLCVGWTDAGKRLFRLRIVRAEGAGEVGAGALALRQIIIRNFAGGGAIAFLIQLLRN